MTDFQIPTRARARAVVSRDGLEYTIGPGCDFDSSEIRILKEQARKQGAKLPLPRDVLEAILRVKRILGGEVVNG